MSDDDDLSEADLALIQDPNFYRSGHNRLTRRLAVAVLEFRRQRDHETPDAKVEAANELLMVAHEEQVRLSHALADANRLCDELYDRIATLRATLTTERDRLKLARSEHFERMEAKRIRIQLRQIIKALTP